MPMTAFRSCGRMAIVSSTEVGAPTITASGSSGACRYARRRAPVAIPLDRLVHEYELRDALDSAWAARPLALGREDGRMALLLEDPGGEPLERLIGAPMDTGRFLRLAIGAVAALGKAHQRGLVHKDVKPTNILANCADGRMRLTGFGIASRLPRERQAPEPPGVIAGTLAYGAGTDRADELLGQLAQRPLRARRRVLSDAHWSSAVRGGRSNGLGPLPYRSKACSACGDVGERSGPDLGNRHEAPRQDGRGSLPDRRRRRARSAALSCRMGGPGPRRTLCAWRMRQARSAHDPGETSTS